MTITEFVSIMSLGSILISGGALWLAIKKRPHETRSLDADSVETFERAATQAAKRAEEANAKADRIQLRFDELFSAYGLAMEEIKELRAEIAEVKSENGSLRQWADLLVKQVVQLGGSPAPMPREYTRPRPKREGE